MRERTSSQPHSREQGHEVRLIPAQFVKPYRKSNKNDFIDAEAIAEAVTRQNMRFVPIKTQEQLDLQAMHRVRDRLVQRRTALINEIRGFLLERGITFRGAAHLPAQEPADGDRRCRAEPEPSPALAAGSAVAGVEADWRSTSRPITDEIERISKDDARCRRLRQIPGVGPLVSTATVAAIGNGAAFRKGRDFAAWVGLVPRQYSTGGKQQLFGISKRGNVYLRRMFIHGARAVLFRVKYDTGGFGQWVHRLEATCSAQQGRGRHRQQAGSHRLGRAVQRQRLSTSAAADRRPLDGRGKDAALGKHKNAFHFPTATTTTDLK